MAEDGGDRDQQQQQQQQPAAAAAAPEGRGGESVKLFVGQVPKQMTEAELAAMFRGVSLVDEVTVIRDRATRVSRGPDPYASSLLPLFARRLNSFVRAAMQCGGCSPAPRGPGGLGFSRIWVANSSEDGLLPSVAGEGARVSGFLSLVRSNAATELELLFRWGRRSRALQGVSFLDLLFLRPWGFLVHVSVEFVLVVPLVLCGKFADVMLRSKFHLVGEALNFVGF